MIKTEFKENNPWLEFSKNLVKYRTPSLKKSIWQIVNSFVPYVAIWFAIIFSLSVSLWLTAFLIILNAGFLVRLFIIFHDCGHGSFFQSKKANSMTGFFLGILVFTPYDKWHNMHRKHHATVGNLDKRGAGDVWTMTKEEYMSSSKWEKLQYRIYRNPFIMFGLGPLLLFMIQNRFTKSWMNKNEKLNLYLTNLGLLVLITGMSFIVGFFTFIIIQLIIVYLSAVVGIWLFYLQHQYDGVEWYRSHDWNYQTVALKGSSFVKFPKILQWFSGNIGFHHIHHLNAGIPNYNFEKCHVENHVFNDVEPVKFMDSLKTLKLRLWDEKQQKLVSFR